MTKPWLFLTERIRKRHDWKPLLLSVLIIVQVLLVTRSYISVHMKEFLKRRDLLAFERSGVGVFGAEGFAYMEFILDEVPPSGIVVIPSTRPDTYQEIQAMWHITGVMEYFLMPREVIKCPCTYPEKRCAACLETDEYYILAIGNFPPFEEPIDGKVLVSFSDRVAFYRGIYSPISGVGQ